MKQIIPKSEIKKFYFCKTDLRTVVNPDHHLRTADVCKELQKAVCMKIYKLEWEVSWTLP